MGRKVTFVQFSNPAAYPPVLHAASLLADAGWEVEVLGVAMDGTESFQWPEGLGIQSTIWPSVPAGRARQMQYVRFIAAAIQRVRRRRPEWVYASDPFAAPIALAVARLGLARVVYHEHDAPGAPESALMKAVGAARRAAVRGADTVIVPNEARLTRLVAETGRTGPTVCVWNVPAASEVAHARKPLAGPPVLYYHGTLNPSLLPTTILDAMARTDVPLRLRAVGYETIGNQGYSRTFLNHAERLGLSGKVEVAGPAPRAEVIAAAHAADIGLALMPMQTGDVNLEAMAGASNKAFDYLSGGLPLIVSDLLDWRELYVEPGYALAADPASPSSLMLAFERLASDPETLRRMGDAGRQRVACEWNYERQFQSVKDTMEMTDPLARTPTEPATRLPRPS